MKKWFEKYKRFFWVLFLLWLVLWTGRKSGFDFGVELFSLFRLVFFLGIIWVIGEIRMNWGKIYPVAKSTWLKQKSNFSARIKVTQAEIIAFSPKVLGGKAVSFIILPLVIIILALCIFRQIIEKIFQFLFSKEAILFWGVLGILVDVFVSNLTSDLIILFLAGAWIWSIRSYKFEGKVSITGALVFLTICPFLLIFKQELIAEKAAIWAYIFLVVGIIQMLVEDKEKEKR